MGLFSPEGLMVEMIPQNLSSWLENSKGMNVLADI
jgi:hypothetical protein